MPIEVSAEISTTYRNVYLDLVIEFLGDPA